MNQDDSDGAENNVLLVGLGASAGGLDALKEFFSSLPEKPGMAFIVIIHLSPDRESKMAKLLQRQTSLPVTQVTGRTEVKSNHVYVIPPNKFLSVKDHHLDLTDPDDGHGLATVDLFFHTLASTKGRYAACTILSGTGTDGSVGMKAIKEKGGLAVVQDPDEAGYPGMPESAINTGLADVVLPAGDMAGELLAYKENLDQIRLSESDDEELQSVNEELKTVNQQLESKVDKLRRINSDLKNLTEATQIGILFLDRKFCLQHFTSAATDIFNLTATDLGRPLAHFTHRLEYDSLDEDLNRSLESLDNIKKVVSSRDGRRYVMRLRPYQSTADKIEGVVLTFVDITELREARRQLAQQRKQESLATLGVYALEHSELGSIFHRALQQLCIGLEVDYALLLSWNTSEDMLHLQDQTGWKPDKDHTTTFDADKKWDTAYTLGEKKPVVTANYDREKRFTPSPAVDHLKIASGVHMRVAGSQGPWGVLGLYASEPREYSEDDVNFIQVVANVVGIAIERNETKKALQEEVKRSKQYQKQILNNSIIERWNVGGYLHDELAQQLIAIKMNIHSIKDTLEQEGVEISPDFATVSHLIDNSISSIRNLSHDIIPVDIEADGVGKALQFLARKLQTQHNIRCLLEVGPIIDEIKNRKVASNLYLIIQEAIKNAAIHGKAQQVRIVIQQKCDHLQLQINDDGKGLSATAREGKSEGSGVNIMRHRMELHGGEFTIKEITHPQEGGTRITCRLPVKYLKKAKE